MLSTGSRMRLALVATVCLAFLSGCAGSKGERLAFWPEKKPAQTAESSAKPAQSSVLNSQQTADVQLALGRTAEQQQQWPAAMTIYRRMLDADPKHPEATHRMAVLYDRQGEFEQSSQWFQKTLKLKPGDPDVFCDLGFSLYSQCRYSEAETNFQQALALQPEHARSQNHLGLVLAQQGEREASLAAFRRANCSSAQAHTNLAVILALNNHVDDAKQHLQLARQELAPDDSDGAIQEQLEGLEMLIAKHESRPTPPPAGDPVYSTAMLPGR